VAPPQVLYDRPVNLFVGGFIGSPSMNMIEVTVDRSNGSLFANAGDQRLRIDDEAVAAHPALRSRVGTTVVLRVRPENLPDPALAPAPPPAPPGDRRLHGVVRHRESLGSEVMAHIVIPVKMALTEDVRELAEDVGDDRTLEADADGTPEATIVGRFGNRSQVAEGDRIEVSV